jgi:cation transport ATPase-like protein
VLPFLPMLPSQILLNNLLYDAGQLTIPTDHVDPEQVQAPARWDLHMIRRFMLLFGPLSSLFDFLTFAIMIGLLHAGPELPRGPVQPRGAAAQVMSAESQLAVSAVHRRAHGRSAGFGGSEGPVGIWPEHR